MEIGGKLRRSGEQPLSVLAAALSVQLDQPLGKTAGERFIGAEEFHTFSLPGKNILNRGITVCRIEKQIMVRLIIEPLCGAGTFHQGPDVMSRGGDGKQSHRSQYREPSAHIPGDFEPAPALFLTHLPENTAGRIGGAPDPAGSLAAISPLHQFQNQPERNGRLGGGTGFGDDIDGDLPAFTPGENLREMGGTHIVAEEQHFGAIGTGQEVQCGLGTEIGAADADHQQDVRLFPDCPGCGFHSREEFLSGITREGAPALGLSVRGVQALPRCRKPSGVRVQFRLGNKAAQKLFI